MATELNQPLSPLSNPPQAPPPSPPPPPAYQLPLTLPLTDPIPTPAPKRHRRPSVRLGDIGGESLSLRRPRCRLADDIADHSPSLPTSKPWRFHPKSSKTRPLTNLPTPNGNKHLQNPRSTSKKPRVHHPPPALSTNDDLLVNTDNDVNFHTDDHGFKDFDLQGSDNDVHHDHDSADNVALLDAWRGHNHRSARVSDSRPEIALESNSGNKGGSGLGLDDGIRNWLVGLGLGRYAPVFEIHEVDEEVLLHLTLDDLKDMGINAVGTRRKLYFAIQKLGKSALS